jgi:anti-sigma factor RsiW
MTADPMCAVLADAIEPIAAGEWTPDTTTAAHLSACASCAAALEHARRVDQLLRARPAPVPSPDFTLRTLRLIQRAGWRREQVVDWIFNSALIAAALLVAVGIWIALQRAGMPSVGRDALEVFSNGMAAAAQRAAPSLPLYAGATGLIVVALGLWWWASDAAL